MQVVGFGLCQKHSLTATTSRMMGIRRMMIIMSLMLVVVEAVLTCRVIATGDVNTAKVDDILNTRLNVYSPLAR